MHISRAKIKVRFGKCFVSVAAAIILVLFTGSIGLADGGGFYVAGKAGLGFIDGDVSMDHNQTAAPTGTETTMSNQKSNFSYGGAIGWNWLDSGIPIRTEVEYYDHGSFNVDHSDSNATFSSSASIETVQLNVYYDFYTDTSFIPYVGAGVGVASMKGTNCKSTSNVSYSLFGGTGYKMTDSLLLDFTYRVNNFGNLNVNWSDTNNSYSGKVKDIYSVEAVFGVRYQF